MAPKRKATAPAPAPAPAAPKPVNQRGKEWAAERLTGKRAQSGKLPGGGPRYTYEVVWKVTGGKRWANTWEPADCLIGWEAEMSEVDKKIVENAQQAPLRLAAQANAVREAAAKKKAAELADRRQRLLRKQQRQQARGETPSDDEGEEDGEEDEEDDSDLPAAADELAAALHENLEQLRQLGKDPTEQQNEPQKAGAADAATPGSTEKTKGKKQGPSRVWLAFDWATQRCKLPHPEDRTRVCNAEPCKGTGTSGHRLHLNQFHSDEWTHILKTGEVKTTVQMIKEALAAKTDLSKPELGEKERDELHRLVALWVSKCGRPQYIVADKELKTLLARILELCKARLRYELPDPNTVSVHLKLLGNEGKALGRDFIVRLLKSGVKPSISGDLWSESGMGLFGIYAHGITETWVMEKALIGLVACEKERHTAENIKKWTEEALTDIGFTTEKLMAQG